MQIVKRRWCTLASIILIATCAFFVSSLAGGQSEVPEEQPALALKAVSEGWTSLNGSDPDTPLQVESFRSTGEDFGIRIKVSGFSMEKVFRDDQEFQAIKVPNQCYWDTYGVPGVPMVRRLFAITSGDFEVEVVSVVTDEYAIPRLMPQQPPEEEGEALPFEIDDQIYSTDAFYPEKWADASAGGSLRNIPFGRLEVALMRYNPVRGVALVAREIEVKVRFKGVQKASSNEHILPLRVKKLADQLFINSESVNDNFRFEDDATGAVLGQTMAGATDYLIITDPQYIGSGSLNSLVSYHQGQGRTVEVKDVTTIGTTQTEIKNYIQSVYDSQTPPELDFVLLIGDVDVIPMPHNTWSSYHGDIYYGWVAGSDIVADIGVGRFPAVDQTQLFHMVQKTLDFQNNTYGGPWREKTLLVAHQEEYPGKYTECKETIANHTYTLTPPTFIKMYGGDPSVIWTNNDVNNTINEGVVVVNYRGHGGDDEWRPWSRANEAYTNTDAYNMNNGTKTPVIFNICCNSGDIEFNPECLIEAQIRHPTGGAVASLSATAPSATTVNHDFDRFLYFGTWDLGIESIGELLNYADGELLTIYGNHKNIVMYHWVGDPAVSIRVLGPPPPQYTLTVNTSGPGSVTLDPPDGTYVENTEVTLTATGDYGYMFDYWSGDLSGTQNPTTITMTADKNVTAHFVSAPQYNLVVTTDGNGTVTLDPPGGTYYAQTNVTMTATPNAGYVFDHWSGDYTGTDNPAVVSVDKNMNVMAHFSLGYTSLPYSSGFESGDFDQYWFTQSSHPNGRIRITGEQTPHTGSYHLTMDVSTSGTYVTNEAWLKVNLAGHANVNLSFWWKEHGDENHAEDGVYLSDNGGTTFVKVYDLTGGSSTYQQINLDIDQLAAANGLSMSGTFVIKFQQHDNYPFTSDGFCFDDIKVTMPVNQPPVADANGPYTGNTAAAVSFSSAGSNDPDGTIVSYLWDFGDDSTSTEANPSHQYSAVNTYTVTLTVTDNEGATGSDTTSANIVDPSDIYATLPYSSGFESGDFDQYWFTQSSHPNGRIRITGEQTPHTGSYHLTMDVSTSGTYVTNEAWLRLNLSGLTQVDLSFWWKEHGDENHAEDGVYLSDNGGTTFVKVYDLTGGSSTYQQINLDIDQLAAANGLSMSGTFVIKFQQHDNYPFTSDGFCFDDISVTCPGGP